MASRKWKAIDGSDNGKDSTPDSDKYFPWTDDETALDNLVIDFYTLSDINRSPAHRRLRALKASHVIL